MIGLSAAVYCCLQLSLCLAGPITIHEGRHLSLSVPRKITVNVFLFSVYKRFFLFLSRFYVF